MAQLAQRLNELAVANSEGLLNDDEYRLLRQNLFERYSSTTVIPVEVPVVPIARHARRSPTSPVSTPRRPTVEHIVDNYVDSPTPRHPSLTRKRSMASGMSNLLRRATGRKTSISNDPSTKGSNPFIAVVTASPNNAPKQRGVIPRMLHRKASNLAALLTDESKPPKELSASASQKPNSIPDVKPSAGVHTRSLSRDATSVPPGPVGHDVFDDGNLHTSKDIRQAIEAVQAEAKRILDSFNSLEHSTMLRLQEDNAPRRVSPSPSRANILIDGRQWRDSPSPLAIPTDPTTTIRSRRRPAWPTSANESTDHLSIRSGSSSIRTSLSQSKSIPSLPRQPGSPLSPRFQQQQPPLPASPTSPGLSRKGSLSSISSHASIRAMQAKLGSIRRSNSLSRSTGNLSLTAMAKGMRSSDKLGMAAGGGDRESPVGSVEVEEQVDPEVAEIRKRKVVVSQRYEARLEYLRAKLKGAELHEKLMRK